MNRGLWVEIRVLRRGLMYLLILLFFSASFCFDSNGHAGPMQTPNAQKITGKWQGAIRTPNGQLRIVIEISSDLGSRVGPRGEYPRFWKCLSGSGDSWEMPGAVAGVARGFWGG